MAEGRKIEFNLEESFAVTLDLGKFSESNTSKQSMDNATNQEQQFNGSILTESIPVIHNGQSVQNQIGSIKIQKSDTTSQTTHNISQNQNLLESFPISINFQNVQESNNDSIKSEIPNPQEQININSKQNLEKKESFQLLESFPIRTENFQFTTGDSGVQKMLSQQIEQEELLKQQRQETYDPTQKKGKMNENISNNNSSSMAESGQIQSLTCTQVINENEKGDQSDQQFTGEESFEPDVIQHTDHKIKKVYRQFFQLKQIVKSEQNKSSQLPALLLESNGKDKIIIGRSPKSDIQIKDQTVSSKHAQILWKPVKKTWSLSDEGSTNGTYLVINNAAIKVDDEILIGLHLCKIMKLKKSFPIEVELRFENAVDDEIPPFTVVAQIEIGKKFMIGKKHQAKLQDDFCIEDDHCYIFFENQKIKIKNCENVFHKTAKKLDKTKEIEINLSSVIRFGFIDQYEFIPYQILAEETTQEKTPGEGDGVKKAVKKEQAKCISCKIVQSYYYRVEPCLHSQLCIMCANQGDCPICGKSIQDFK